MTRSPYYLTTSDCIQSMKRPIRMFAARALFVAGTVLSSAAQADVELTAPDGRRILLKDNGTWLYVEADRTADTINKEGEAILVLERKVERGNGCRIAVRLENNLPYEIRSLVPYYSVYAPMVVSRYVRAMRLSGSRGRRARPQDDRCDAA